MFCNKCGNELIAGVKFCGKCGKKLRKREAALSMV